MHRSLLAARGIGSKHVAASSRGGVESRPNRCGRAARGREPSPDASEDSLPPSPHSTRACRLQGGWLIAEAAPLELPSGLQCNRWQPAKLQMHDHDSWRGDC